ncbi:MAG: RluA family pseudouridine synthase [Saprospiraceae bacterium]
MEKKKVKNTTRITQFDKNWILYEDKDIIIVNKPGTVPIQKDSSKDLSLFELVHQYCGGDLQLIHRLDRPVSGAVVFAKHLKAAIPLFLQFEQRSVQKMYFAIVHNKPLLSKGTLLHYLEKSSKYNRSVAHLEERPNTKKAILEYEIIGENENFHLLKVTLHTGRHHQIRVQLDAIDCSIRGDAKYGFRRANKDRSINLHSRFLRIAHPITKKEISVVAPFPTAPIWTSFKPYKES